MRTTGILQPAYLFFATDLAALEERPAAVGAYEHSLSFHFRILKIRVPPRGMCRVVVAAKKLTLAAYHRTFAA